MGKLIIIVALGYGYDWYCRIAHAMSNGLWHTYDESTTALLFLSD